MILSVVVCTCDWFCSHTTFPKVDSAWSSGNYEEARRQSNIAKVLNFIGIGIGIGVWAVVGIYVVAQIAISAAIVS